MGFEFLQVTWLQGFGLVATRTGALVSLAPILGSGTGFFGYKVALIFFAALMLSLASGAPLETEVDALQFGMLALREALIGLFLGFLLHVVMLAVHVAGEFVSHEMGMMIARQVDPASGAQNTLVSSLYENLFLMAFLALNGHHLLLRSLDESFEQAPIGSLSLGGGLAETAQSMFTEMFGAGLVFAAPVLVFLVMVSILMGLLARAVPTLNILELGFTIRILVALGAMAVFAPLLAPGLNTLYDAFFRWMRIGLGALEG